METKKRRLRTWPFIYLLQILATFAIAFFVVKLNMLPFKYLLIVLAILFLFLLLTFLMMVPKKNKKKWIRTLGKLLSLLLSIVLLVGSIFISKGSNTLNLVTKGSTVTIHYGVFVKKDSTYETIEDLKNAKVMYSLNYDSEEDMQKLMKEIKKQNQTIKFKKEKSHDELATYLFEDEVDGILVNSAYNGTFEEKYPTFKSEVKEIWSYETTIEVEDISKDVDVTKKPFTVYISGIDTDGPVDTVARSDVNMIVTVNPKTHQILMTSIPRDYYVEMAHCKKKDKLNHSGLEGINNTIKTVENFMNIDINYYARVNFTSLQTMVDALGGLDIYSDQAFTSGADNTIHVKKGMQHMDGYTALCFARERKAYATGDLHRTQNQQVVLTAMIHKACSPQIIASYSKMLKAVEGCLDTNLTNDEIASLVKFQLGHMNSWEIKHTHLSGEGKTMKGGALMPNTRVWYTMPDEEAVELCSELINEVLDGAKVDDKKVEKIERMTLY